MCRFWKDTKGATTVFITLLLIPAMLVTGTAVDLSRIHTARSIVRDANQLAANAMLTQYDALLNDIYGMFGVMAEDPELAEMVNNYIDIAIFGEGHEQGLGTFQLFYGSDLQPGEPLPALDKNLRDTHVLRRQIEEYMKFRGPVIIVKEFLDALDNNTIEKDTEIIKEKLDIEADIADLFEDYKELYKTMSYDVEYNGTDRCDQAIGGAAGGYFGAVSSTLGNIQTQLDRLSSLSRSWRGTTNPERKSSLEDQYNGVLDRISNLADSLERTIDNAKSKAEDFKDKFDNVVAIAERIDSKQADIERKIDEFEKKLSSGAYDPALRDAFTTPGGDGLSYIGRYRKIIEYEITPMASWYQTEGYQYIDEKLIPLLEDVKYRDATGGSAKHLTRPQLASIPWWIDNCEASDYASFGRVSYGYPDGFIKFGEIAPPLRNAEFYPILETMMKQPALDPVKLYEGQANVGGGNAEEQQRNLIDALLNLVETAYTGLTNSPLGAKHMNDPGVPALEPMGVLEILTLIPEALSQDVVGIIQDPIGSLGKAGNYMLLLTYNTGMFSNYSTTKPENIGKELDEINFTKTISGVPISPEVNYFFQSEWEYLYNGHENAGKNLNAITRLLFMARLVSNYITVFRVNEISAIVTSMQASFAWCPPLGLFLGELARAAFVAAETAVDVAALRTGQKVPLFKNVASGEWKCNPSGVINMVNQIAVSETGGGGSLGSNSGMNYSHYMLFFFITKALFYSDSYGDAATELADRTTNLIEWNLMNYRSNINANEDEMSAVLASGDRFEMYDMKTDFSITTTVNLRMLFLSMPFAQRERGAIGVVPPRTMPVTVTDYRGY